ncbi:sensor histidine kinase [Paenibacillus sp.]|uniref:sensor histidine kinase n=1 Tax=Paenibacillus sp. TaxID=58172 RepID=UPI002D76C8B0|nr:sensor histidine kinase [Paenibacillus sp.]
MKNNVPTLAKPGRSSFRRQFLVSYVMVLLIPFVSTLAVFGFQSMEETKSSYSDFMRQLTSQTNTGLDNFFINANRITLMHIIDDEVADILAKPDPQPDAEYVGDLRKVKISIDHAVRLNPDISGVTFVGKNGNVYSNTDVDETYMRQVSPWYTLAEQSAGGAFITPVYDGTFFQNRTKLISIVRVLTGWNTEKIGYVNVDIHFQSILAMIGEKDQKHSDVETLLIDKESIIYDSYRGFNELSAYHYAEIVGTIRENLNAGRDNVFEYKTGDNGYLVAAAFNETTGWLIVKYMPLDVIVDKFKSKISYFVSILLASLALAAICAYGFSLRISKPITRLVRTMKMAKTGKFTPIMDFADRNDEVGELFNSYNAMIKRINEGIQKEYLADINQKKIEFKMLQAQINPHFLYNTLNVISSIAELNNVNEIQDITHHLAKMFRYSITPRDSVRLSEELEQVRHYVSIQQVRFLGKIQVVYDIEESLLQATVMKFLLQPFIENAVYHGIEPKGGKGTLRLTTRIEDSLLLFIVEDDGVGMPEERLRALNDSLSAPSAPSAGRGHESLGVKNVHQRIKDYYGDDYGIQLRSSPGQGTSVYIRIPLPRSELTMEVAP